MDCLQYHYSNQEDSEKYKINCRDISYQNLDNIEEIFKIADGCVIGSSLKHEGITWNNIDPERVKKFMDKVNKLRS